MPDQSLPPLPMPGTLPPLIPPITGFPPIFPIPGPNGGIPGVLGGWPSLGNIPDWLKPGLTFVGVNAILAVLLLIGVVMFLWDEGKTVVTVAAKNAEKAAPLIAAA